MVASLALTFRSALSFTTLEHVEFECPDRRLLDFFFIEGPLRRGDVEPSAVLVGEDETCSSFSLDDMLGDVSRS